LNVDLDHVRIELEPVEPAHHHPLPVHALQVGVEAVNALRPKPVLGLTAVKRRKRVHRHAVETGQYRSASPSSRASANGSIVTPSSCAGECAKAFAVPSGRLEGDNARRRQDRSDREDRLAIVSAYVENERIRAVGQHR
jgi:hypothetical protein